MAQSQGETISSYLIDKLYANGARHVFGVPGDYVLGFYDQLAKSRVTVINNCDEQGAGFAADGYARLSGLGAVCVTYGVGGLKVINTTAQAFAEESPIVVISGAPGTNELEKDPMLHHKVRSFDTQLKVFEEVTIAQTVLDDPLTATREIDRVISAATRYSRPVYIELPRDMVSAEVTHHETFARPASRSEPHVLKEAAAEISGMINGAQKPCILAGAEIKRFGLVGQLGELVERTRIPVATTILGKSIISGSHPLCVGAYAGAIGKESARDYVESSDCLIMLGAYMTDINMGMFTANIDHSRIVQITSERVAVGHHVYENLTLAELLDELINNSSLRTFRNAEPVKEVRQGEDAKPFRPVQGKRISVERFFECINSFLSNHMVVVTDVGEALFTATDLVIPEGTEFLAPAYYASMGFAVPTSIGAQLARPDLRPVVLVGDGAFQMTGMELSTVVRFNLNPIVIVLNNHGYATERVMIDGPFNDVQQWDFGKIPEVVGGGKGFTVEDEEQLYKALMEARDYTEGFSILDVRFEAGDMSPALKRFTSMMSKYVTGEL